VNRSRYREHEVRIRGSLERTVAADPTPPAELQRLVDRARKVGVYVFLKHELDRLPDISRALIETEHRRICERNSP
jgi:hypothetical protein